MYLVTSAAGQTGLRPIAELVRRGVAVRGLVRSAASAARIEAMGAEAYVGALEDGGALRSAMRGIDVLYHICPSLLRNEYETGVGVIDAAREMGVGRFVLHGVMAPYLENIGFHWSKQQVQVALYRSGLPYSVVLPTNFMQNLLPAWSKILAEGQWELPYSTETRLTWVDLDDVVEAVANIMTDPAYDYGTYELCGSDTYLTRSEIAHQLSGQLERRVTAVRSELEPYIAYFRSLPMFAHAREAELDDLRKMYRDYDRVGMPAGNSKVLSMLLGRPANGFAEFFAKQLAA